MTVIDDPAVAVAVGHCLGARSVATETRPAVTERHPRPCGWCDYPLEDLRRMLEGWNQWAEYNARSNTFGHHELRIWTELPRAEQEARVLAAQAFPELAPVASPEPAPAHGVDEEGPAWMR